MGGGHLKTAFDSFRNFTKKKYSNKARTFSRDALFKECTLPDIRQLIFIFNIIRDPVDKL